MREEHARTGPWPLYEEWVWVLGAASKPVAGDPSGATPRR